MQSPSAGPSKYPSTPNGAYSSSLPNRTATVDDHHSDEDDYSPTSRHDDQVLSTDPVPEHTSGQRKPYPNLSFPLPTFLSSPRPRFGSQDDINITPNLRRRHTPTTPTLPAVDRFELRADDLDSVSDEGDYDREFKDFSGTGEWTSEGLGRRAGYDDLTAIDWIFEYAKERERLRTLLSNTGGAAGAFARFYDSGQIWLLLVLTGIGTGIFAASIDIVSDWLGDLKEGVCTAGPGGGRFYLNKTFCCWGWDGKNTV